MFEFRDRITKAVVKRVDITSEVLEKTYDDKLKNIFAEYEIQKHTAHYNSQEQF